MKGGRRLEDEAITEKQKVEEGCFCFLFLLVVYFVGVCLSLSLE